MPMIDVSTHTRKIWRSHFDGTDGILFYNPVMMATATYCYCYFELLTSQQCLHCFLWKNNYLPTERGPNKVSYSLEL
jgi:hypothetical protein